ncbi:MAG: 3-oxoadipate enol-lactonase 2 [Chlamydiia bacterium]|nr:3-oxoadipate enol-lactonase 2 [Chlamydiia bacterium]
MEEIVEINGNQLHFRVNGEGTPLVLIPGLALDLNFFSPIAKELAARHKVIVLDNRCAGKSGTPEKEVTIEQMAEDVVGLLDHLDISRAAVFGHSMGSMVATCLAARWPERVNRLILGATFPRLNILTQVTIQSVLEMLKLGTQPEVVRSVTHLHNFSPSAFDHPDLINRYEEALCSNPPAVTAEGFEKQARALFSYDPACDLRKIQTKTLILGGQDDTLTPASYLPIVDEEISDSSITLIPGGHSFVWESSEECVREIKRFIEE